VSLAASAVIVAEQQWQLLATTAWPALITVAGYLVGLAVYRASGGNRFLHPLVIAAPAIYLLVELFELPLAGYDSGNGALMLGLQLVTVGLALPLALQARYIPAIYRPLAALVLVGGVVAALLAVGLAAALSIEPLLLRSVAAKSVTSPIAIGITEELGGIVAVVSVSVLLTGLIGSMLAPRLYRALGVDDDRWQGLILGICAHGVGTASAFETSRRCGAFATLGMGLTGIWSSLFLPWLVPWLLPLLA